MRKLKLVAAAALSTALVALSPTPAHAATSATFYNDYLLVYVDAGQTYPYVKVCDRKSDGERVEVEAWGAWHTLFAAAEDANGNNGTSDSACGIGYFSARPDHNERIYIQGWRQDGANGTPHNWLDGAFTFTG
ncbi:hypothetical protein ACFFWC_12030 [Plantactinospora siamensis]|uniref:Secreted protein n=1 Tax=Plantactinospora siamensis TaxID=555372 RepID=A0ABV6P335_9ACTN